MKSAHDPDAKQMKSVPVKAISPNGQESDVTTPETPPR